MAEALLKVLLLQGLQATVSSHNHLLGIKDHDLQKECKKRLLKATGTVHQLRNQLMGKEDAGKIISYNIKLTNNIILTISSR